ncbi:ABC transporter permease subunit, partial [Bacillus subtilis]
METVPKKGDAPVLTAGKGISWMAALKRDKWLYLLLIPGLLYFLIFKYLPMWGVLIAFKDYSPYLGFWKSEWVGFDYFKDFFMNPDFFRLLRNTLMLASLDLLFAFPAPLILALLLNEVRKAVYKRCIQTFIYVPHFVSWTIVVSITFVFFTVDTGVINKMIMSLTGEQISFLSDADWFRPMIVMQSIWKETGWGTILFLAVLATVDQEQYEAAIMDGAGRFRRMWHITLPAIRSTIIVLLILRIGSFLNLGFEQVYLMTNSLNRS